MRKAGGLWDDGGVVLFLWPFGWFLGFCWFFVWALVGLFLGEGVFAWFCGGFCLFLKNRYLSIKKKDLLHDWHEHI